ncbi:MAG: hypothetical protein JJ921_04880 [Pseudomonadales bacterium]|nr:hypothetical protein [Pseudomonadales bacterium]MBO7006902.1 hypothetical protein [Pseudomonadales bacterium]
MRLFTFLALTLWQPSLNADPKSHYMIHCMGCHLVSGEGMPPDVPAFNSDLSFLASTEDGRRYLVQVPGASQSLINDAELANLLNWMLKKYAPNPETRAFTGEEIIKYRHDILADPKAERTRLFAAHH